MGNNLVDTSGNSDGGNLGKSSEHDSNSCAIDLKSGQDMASFLPFEVLLQILESFSSMDLLLNIRPISLRWKQIANYLIRHKLHFQSRLKFQSSNVLITSFPCVSPPEEYICHPIDSGLQNDDLCIWEYSRIDELEKLDIAKVSPHPQLKEPTWIYFPKKITLIPSPSWMITLPTDVLRQCYLTQTQRESFISESGQCYWVQIFSTGASSAAKNKNTWEVRLRVHSSHGLDWICTFKHGEENGSGDREATLLRITIPISQLVKAEYLYKKIFEREDLWIRLPWEYIRMSLLYDWN
jgi:hypothetical protein